MPPIGGVDDVWARLISGFVLAGLPDATRGGVSAGPGGQLNVENLLQPARAGEGILLELPGLPDSESPEVAYSVRLVRAGEVGGYGVEARCAETLFHHVWPTVSPEALAGVILEAVRTHHTAWLDWRQRGGMVSYAERLGVPALPVEVPDQALIRFLGGLYREGRSLQDGPTKGWWAPATVWAGGITAGKGEDPMWRLGPSADTLTEEEKAHASRLKSAGWGAVIYGAIVSVFTVEEVGRHAWYWWVHETFPWWGLGSIGGAALSCALWLAAGQALVRGRDRWFFADASWTRWMLYIACAYGMVPCASWCCLGGLPLGGWLLYLLLDARTKRIL